MVEPLKHPDEEWRRDLPGDRSQYGVGEKAWTITQMLSVVPPEHWEERFGVEPSDLIAAAHGDWEMALLAGWCRASALHEDSRWAMPLWQACYQVSHDLEGWQTWLTALSVADLLPHSYLASALGRLPQNGEMPLRLSSTLQAIAGPWQPELSEAFLEGMHKRISGIRKYGPAQGRAVGQRACACLDVARIREPETGDRLQGESRTLARSAGSCPTSLGA